MPEYTEGVCGDGVAILRDGVPVPVSEILRRLNGVDRRFGITVRRKRYGCEVCGARQNGVEILLGADKEYGAYSIWAQLAAKMPAEILLAEIRDRVER